MIFFNGQTLRVHKLETEEGGGGQGDVPGLYFSLEGNPLRRQE